MEGERDKKAFGVPLSKYKLVSPEVYQRLKQAALNEEEITEILETSQLPKDEIPLETHGFDAFESQLANGNNVKVVFARFWERIRYQDWREGARPAKYFAIKVYSNEDILSRQMVVHCEFRGGKDFSLLAVPKLWGWLEGLMEQRRLSEFDSVADFIDELAEEMSRLSDEGEDALEHLNRLPGFEDSKAFDRVDDSIFNDQNDPA